MASAAESVIDLYQRNAAAWDADRGRSLVERPWLERFAALLPPGGSVLDLGCGSGEPIAGHLIGAGYAVAGVDAAPALVRLCRQRFPAQDWIVADMRALSLPRRFDGILAWDSLFHLASEDQRGMFPILGRHAAPDAALMFTSGPAEGEAIGTWRDEPLYHASLDGAEYRALLAAQGFAVAAHAVEDPACGGRTIWLARRG